MAAVPDKADAFCGALIRLELANKKTFDTHQYQRICLYIASPPASEQYQDFGERPNGNLPSNAFVSNPILGGKAMHDSLKQPMMFVAAVLVIASIALPTWADDFKVVGFSWGNIRDCNSGRPNTVSNPEFTLSGVPEGTVRFSMYMIDLDAPGYNHGGGKAKYTGGDKIMPGAFKYKSPCPPGQVHRYVWRITAKDKNGKTVGKTKTEHKYPVKK